MLHKVADSEGSLHLSVALQEQKELDIAFACVVGSGRRLMGRFDKQIRFASFDGYALRPIFLAHDVRKCIFSHFKPVLSHTDTTFHSANIPIAANVTLHAKREVIRETAGTFQINPTVKQWSGVSLNQNTVFCKIVSAFSLERTSANPTLTNSAENLS